MHLRRAALLVLVAASATAQAPLLPPPPPPLAVTEFQARRAALAGRITAAHPGERAIVVVRGAAKQADFGAFVQDQDFLYLTGVGEPGLALLLVLAADGTLERDELLVPPHSPFAATWDGNFLAPGTATAERTGFATAGNVRSLHTTLGELLGGEQAAPKPRVFTLLQPAARTGSTPRKAAEAADGVAKDRFDGRPAREEAFASALTKAHPGVQLDALEPFVHAMRPTKTAPEIAVIRRCAEIAAEGIAEAMRSCEPGHFEYQLAATARFVFTLRGAGPDAYAAIVGGGPNGCVLHYNTCDRRLLASDLIVMDYAPTLHGYATDVTRTFPASGAFTPEQKKLVQDVYDVQQALIAEVKPGARLSVLGRRCAEMLVARGYRNDHGPCHHVGLAVHDPSVDVLAAGMVITVEPGAYLRDVGMGCRIEDTILVTADGNEVLSKDVPSTPDAIEKLMAEAGVLQAPLGAARR